MAKSTRKLLSTRALFYLEIDVMPNMNFALSSNSKINLEICIIINQKMLTLLIRKQKMVLH